jgi:hypothetical protein
MDALKTAVNATFGSAIMDYSFANFKVTITLTSTNTLRLVRFATNKANKIYNMMGLLSTSTLFTANTGSSFTFENPVNMQFVTMMKLKVSDV